MTLREWVRLDRRALIDRVALLVEEVRQSRAGALLVVIGDDDQDRNAAADYVVQTVSTLGASPLRIPLDDRQVTRPRDLLARAWKAADRPSGAASLPASLTSADRMDVDALIEKISATVASAAAPSPVFVFDTIDSVDGLRREQTRCFQTLAQRSGALVIVFSREESQSQWAPHVMPIRLTDLPLYEIAHSLGSDPAFSAFAPSDILDIINTLVPYTTPSGCVPPADAYDVVSLRLV